MMARYSRLLSILIIVAGAFGLYQVKYKVQSLQVEAAELTAQLNQEREGLHVASAEWAYLNRPERVQVLADKYLKLAPIAAMQIADVEIVPLHDSQLASTPDSGLVKASLASAQP